MNIKPEAYPYFQAAHVLNLKALKKQHSFKYNDMLKKTAAYTTNRTILFDFITADTLDIVKKNEEDEQRNYRIGGNPIYSFHITFYKF